MNSKGKAVQQYQKRGARARHRAKQTVHSSTTEMSKGGADMPKGGVSVPKGGVSMPKGGVVRPEGGAEEWKALFMEEPLKSVPLDDLRKNHSKEVVEKVQKFLVRRRNVLSDGTLDQWNAKPPTHDVRCDVRTTVENPKLYASNRQQSPEQREVHAKIIADMLKQGVIEPSKAPWSSNSVVVERDGKKRLVIDYRKLNEVTIRDNYPMPRIQDLTDHLMGTKWFSGIDCTQAFHQVPMADERSKFGLDELSRSVGRAVSVSFHA